MQVYVRDLSGKSTGLFVDKFAPVISMKNKLEDVLGIPTKEQRLVSGTHELDDNTTIDDYHLTAGITLDLSLRLLGGVIEPSLQVLARKYNCDKKVCRKCYARLCPRAQNCRKKKCGHSNHLRAKKKLKYQ